MTLTIPKINRISETPRRAEAATHNESFAFSGTSRCAHGALHFGFKRIAARKSVRSDEVARLYEVSDPVAESTSQIPKFY